MFNERSSLPKVLLALIFMSIGASQISHNMVPTLTSTSRTQSDGSPISESSVAQTTYFDDFSSYPPGQPPSGWLLRGATEITPTIQEIGGTGPAYRLVNFPEVPWQYWDKWLLKDAITWSTNYTVTIKMNFRNSVADRAGLTIAWNDANWNRIDIQPNVYWQDIEFRVSYAGTITSSVVVTNVGTIPISAFTDYWLRAQVNDYGPGNGQVNVYWSADNIDFRPVITATGLAEVSGLAGVSTSGPHLPNTYFDDFSASGVSGGPFYTTSGHVTDSGGNPLPGVTVAAGTNITAATDASGNYAIANLSAGAYTLTPTLDGYNFLPITRTVSVPPNAVGQDFTGTSSSTFVISGRVISGNTSLPGVTVSAGAGGSAITDGNGNFTINSVVTGTYTLTPIMGALTFSPPTMPVSVPPSQTGQNFTALPLAPGKPPLVLVHGFLGVTFPGHSSYTDGCNLGVTQPFHYSLNPSNRDDDVGGKNIDYFAGVPIRFAANYDVWIAHVASGPTDNSAGHHTDSKTPSLEANGACLAWQLEQIYQKNPQLITLVAHSMGGPVSRACLSISPRNPNCDRVKTLITLGSPHAGLPDWELLPWKNDVLAQLGYLELTDNTHNGMPDWNIGHRTRPLVSYMFIGGDYSSFPYHWDLTVGSNSSVGWTPQGTVEKPNWDIPAGCNAGLQSCNKPQRYWTREIHTTYFKDLAPQQPSVSYQCINWFLQGRSGNQPIDCKTKTAQASASSTAFAPQVFSANPQSSPILVGTLLPGGQISRTLQIDAFGSATLVAEGLSSSVSLTLTEPGGQGIDAAYADAHPGVVTYTAISGGLDAPFLTAYSFTATVSGTWQLNLSNVSTATTDYQTFALFDASRTLSATASADNFTIGNSATLTATLANGASGITGATVSAQLIRSDGITDTLPLADHGGGVYTANYSVPNAPGYLPAIVVASGTDNGTPFQRQLMLMLAIAPRTAQLNGAFSSAATDNNGNGLFDTLDVQVGVQTAISGTFTLSGDLLSGGQLVAQGEAYVSVMTGTHTLILSFLGNDIFQSRLNGPYTLTNVSLSDVKYGSIPVALVNNAHTTASYRYTDFEGAQIIYLPLVRR